MKRLNVFLSLLGMAGLLGLSSAAQAACTFDPNVPAGYSAPNGASDLSGQGNYTCAANIGANGLPMVEATGVIFYKNGDWELPAAAQVTDINGFVTNSPDQVVEFPQGNGSRCSFSYATSNAVKGTLLNIGGNVDTNDSIACTDNLVNVEEVNLPEPDLVTTTVDGCNITLSASTPNGAVDQDDFDLFFGTTLDGSLEAVCNKPGVTQNECARGCPEFIDIKELQAQGFCLANADGTIPLYEGNQRCTPCLTSAEAKATIPGFDTGTDQNGQPLKLCWEYTGGVEITSFDPPGHPQGSYDPHTEVRQSQIVTNWLNECYETTTTIIFFGRELTKTVTTCD